MHRELVNLELNSDYADLWAIIRRHIRPWRDTTALQKLYEDHWDRMVAAYGSSHNHQAWPGGYLDHIREVLNLAILLYQALDSRRRPQFLLADVLTVLLLHDLEKPWKEEQKFKTKQERRDFRDQLIRQYGIELTEEQWNALTYVEGEYEDYTPTERKMGEMAALCHMCDIASARLYPEFGRSKDWYEAQTNISTTEKL